MVGIVGEAGVGKSRLCHEFAERCRAQGMPVYHVAGQAHAKSVPLVPVLRDDARLLRRHRARRATRARRERIAGKLLLLDESFGDDLPLIFDFLGVPDPERPPPRMDPEARQRQLLALIKRLVRAQSAREPGDHLFEDLHWLDPASEVFLANHVEAAGDAQPHVVNFRPEYHAPWMSKSYYRQIALPPLGPEAIDEMLGDLLGRTRRSTAWPAVRERTGGNPSSSRRSCSRWSRRGASGRARRYRLVRRRRGDGPGERAGGARGPDRPPREREKAVLQAAAVIGKEFPSRCCGGSSSSSSRSWRTRCARWSRASSSSSRSSIRRPTTPSSTRSPRRWPTARSSAERRAALHAAVARAIAEQDPRPARRARGARSPTTGGAGEALEAARWHARAGAWAGTNDPTGAAALAQGARARPTRCPIRGDGGARARGADLLAAVRLALGISPRRRSDVRRGRGMAAEAGDMARGRSCSSVYGGISGTIDGDTGRRACDGKRWRSRRSPATPPSTCRSARPRIRSSASASTGSAMRMLDRALELADGDTDVAAGIGVGCPYAYCLIFKGGALVNLGELPDARELIDRGMAIAREQGDIETVGWGHMWCTWHAYISGDDEGVLSHARQTVEIADRIGDSFSRVWSWQWLGVAEIPAENWDGAIEALERSTRSPASAAPPSTPRAGASTSSARRTSAPATSSAGPPDRTGAGFGPGERSATERGIRSHRPRLGADRPRVAARKGSGRRAVRSSTRRPGPPAAAG